MQSMRHWTLPLLALVAALTVGACTPAPQADEVRAGAGPIKVSMTVDADNYVPRLAESLGYFRDAGLEVTEVDILKLSEKDYQIQPPLIDGRIQFSYHWAQHAVFGARHGLPVVAVMNITDAPGMKVLVAKDKAGEIKSAADFKGRRVAEGAGYATKAMLMNYLATQAGLPQHAYRPVATQLAGREETVKAGVKAGEIDLVAFMEPLSSRILATGAVETLLDLSSREATEQLLGASIPGESIIVSRKFADESPEVVVAIVQAFARTVDFIKSHSAEDIYDALPDSYRSRKDRAVEIELIGLLKPVYARGGYDIREADMRLLVDMIEGFDFDDSEAGKWRRTSTAGAIDVRSLYDNRFVEASAARPKAD